MKGSIPFANHFVFFTLGGAESLSGVNDQNFRSSSVTISSFFTKA